MFIVEKKSEVRSQELSMVIARHPTMPLSPSFDFPVSSFQISPLNAES